MIPVLLIALPVLAAALGAVAFARPVHAALAMALALAATGILQLALGAAFIGLVQFMVYVGAVAVLILFALLMTSHGDEAAERSRRKASWSVLLTAALPAGAVIASTIHDHSGTTPPGTVPDLPVAALGEHLYTTYAAAVLGVGVLLTAVLIGAALLARDPSQHHDPQP